MKIDFYLTENCNLRCNYCYLNHKRILDMPEKVILRAIDYFLGYQEPQYYITFIGGEPSLKFDLIRKAVNYCNKQYPEKKIFFNIVTNGILLTRKRVEFMKKNEFYMVLSLDGNKVAHDSHRVFANGLGSFDILRKRMPDIKKGINRLFVRMTVTPQNVKHLKDSLGYFIEEEFRCFGYVPTYELEWNNKQLKVFEKTIFWFMDKWEEELERRDVIVLPLINYLLHIDNTRYIFHYFMHPCQLGGLRFSVDVQGNIYPCHRFVSFDRENKKYILGNVNTTEKKILFNVPDVGKDKKKLNVLGCMAVNYEVNRDPLKPLPNYKVFYKIYLRIVKRAQAKNKRLIKLLKKRRYGDFEWQSQFYKK